jgi:acetyl esterase/lipase
MELTHREVRWMKDSLAGGPSADECHVMTDVPYGVRKARRLDIYLPPEAMRPDGRELPVIMHFHGGAWTKGDKGMLAGASAKLALRGFAVFTPNYSLVKRGRNRWPACWEDARSALEWVVSNASEYGCDPSRIGTVGYSAGAHLAALLATRPETRENIRCAVDFFGPSDLGPGRRKVGQYILFGTRRPAPGLYGPASPALLAEAGTPPFMIFHGRRDRLVPAEHSEALHEALLKMGGKSRLFIYDGQPHAFVRPGRDGTLSREALDAFQKAVAFLEEHLGPAGPQDGSRPGTDRQEASGILPAAEKKGTGP